MSKNELSALIFPDDTVYTRVVEYDVVSLVSKRRFYQQIQIFIEIKLNISKSVADLLNEEYLAQSEAVRTYGDCKDLGTMIVSDLSMALFKKHDAIKHKSINYIPHFNSGDMVIHEKLGVGTVRSYAVEPIYGIDYGGNEIMHVRASELSLVKKRIAK